MLDLPYSKLREKANLPATAVGLLALFVVPFVIYWPYLSDFFALDDFIWLKAASNPDPADFLRRALSWPEATPFGGGTPFWRPVVDSYFFVGWRVFGTDPLPYHVTNVLIHGAIASLAAVLAYQLTQSRGRGLLAGLLFVVLPTYDIGVTWISQITELLAVLFYMLTLVLYVTHLRREDPHRLWYWGALVSMVFAFLSKESAVTLPVVLVGLVMVMETSTEPTMGASRAKELGPFVLLTLAYLVFAFVQEYGNSSRAGLYEIGGHGFANMWDFLKWITLPIPDGRFSWIADARPLFAIAFVLLGSTAIVRRNRFLGLTFAWTMLALVPYSFFVAGIEFRYTYLASIPFMMFMAALITAAITSLTRTVGAYPAMSIAAVLVLWVTVFLGAEARDRQWWIGHQAVLYSQLYREAPALCGPLTPESHIILLDSPVWDVYGRSSAMALNLLYTDVYVHRVERSRYPGLAAYVSNKCVLEYNGDRYTLVDR